MAEEITEKNLSSFQWKDRADQPDIYEPHLEFQIGEQQYFPIKEWIDSLPKDAVEFVPPFRKTYEGHPDLVFLIWQVPNGTMHRVVFNHVGRQLNFMQVRRIATSNRLVSDSSKPRK